MIPLYGFVQGDTLGLLVLAEETESIAELGVRLMASAELRVPPRREFRVLYRGRELPHGSTVAACRLEALERIDVV